MMKINTYNDLVYAMARRAKELSDMTMLTLHMEVGTCDTKFGRAQELLGLSKGELVERSLTEEFVEEFDKEWTKD